MDATVVCIFVFDIDGDIESHVHLDLVVDFNHKGNNAEFDIRFDIDSDLIDLDIDISR